MCRDGNTRNKNADPTNAHGSVGLVSHIVNICDSIEISFVRNNCDLTMELETGAIYSILAASNVMRLRYSCCPV